MENIVRTIYGAALQATMLTGTPLVIKPNTTLNEKFGIQDTHVLNNQDMPRLRYATVGNGGHTWRAGADSIPIPETAQHSPWDAALFNHLPFVLREVTQDLTPVEVERYAMRRIETHGGVDYAAYYLRRLPLVGVMTEMEMHSVLNDVTTTTPFIPTSSNLDPVPVDLDEGGANVTTGDYLTASSKLAFVLDAFDVAELLNVARVLYQDEGYAIISEIGLCSGVDKLVLVTTPSGGFNFTESVATQVITHISTFIPLKFTSTGVNMLFDVGATEPLLVLQP